MVSIKDLESLKNLASLLAVPFFTAAMIVDHTFDALRDGIMALPLWWFRHVTQSEPRFAAFFLGCFVLVGLVGVIMAVGTSLLLDVDRAVARIPVVGKHLPLAGWVGLTCITAGLFVVEVVIPGLPPSPLNPFWHLGLLCYGVGLIELWGMRYEEG